ncbi:MAG: DNA-3-methyladenine glycosylase 2 family protein [Clostridia bacterium]|nr:DNA-3-methyladenine glycosylase 2 family protein [Clostridia bacterium]
MNGILYKGEKIYIENATNFDLEQTLDCGQAFRWSKDKNNVWHGMAGGKYIEIYKSEKDIVIEGSSKEDFENFWAEYFDLDRDYGAISGSFESNETLKAAAQFGNGIRILRQEPWEALCSFIISQNNNIPRIKGIIERLCENFGEKTSSMYSFPSAETLAALTPEDLAVIRSGFRAKYIIDAARKVANKEINLEALKTMDYAEAQKELLKIKGVGPKVADCALLYGCGHIEAFPKDVWIKRALEEFFGGEMPKCALDNAGIAQQYIFYYIRENSKKDK